MSALTNNGVKLDGIPPSYPAMSVEEANRLITAPGSPLEMDEKEIRGAKIRVWKHAPTQIADVFRSSVTTYPTREYIIYQSERYTYDMIHKKVSTLATALDKKLHVTKGDRVAIIMRNYPEWIIAFWAVVSLGGIVVPINAWSSGRVLEHCLKDSGSKAAIVDVERAEKIVDSGRLERLRSISLEAVVCVRSNGKKWDGVMTYEELVAGCESDMLVRKDIDPEDDATIFYTSGTTGLPKGALGTHRNFTSALLGMMVGSVRSALRSGLPPPVASPTDPPKSLLLSVPLFHVTGCHAMMQLATYLGAKIVLMYKWDALEALKLIHREKIGTAGGVPSMVWEIIEHPDRDQYDLSSLEGFSYGGAPAAPELVKSVGRVMTNVPTSNGYGLTETSSLTIGTTGPDYTLHPTSIGHPLPTIDIRIADPETLRPLPPNEIGELHLRGPSIVKGYWNNPKATQKSFLKNGWFRTGDIAKLDSQGFIYLLDRAKDMIIRGGENIYCVEVESILASHPAILDVAIIGIPHKTLGEEPAAVVTLRQGYDNITVSDLKEFCKDKLAGFKIPVYVECRKEMLLRNANGKILKRELREQVLQNLTSKSKAKL